MNLDFTQLNIIAGITLQDFKTRYNMGDNVAATYYTELATQGTNSGNTNIVNYANLAMDVTTDSGVNGQMANAYSEAAANDDNVIFTVGSDVWLEMQYELMQQDLTFRQDSGETTTGELGFDQTNQIHANAFDAVGLPPETFTLFTPTDRLGNANPALAQALFEGFLTDSGFGDNAFLDGLTADVLNDWANKTDTEYWKWLGNVAEALLMRPSIVGQANVVEFQDFLNAVGANNVIDWLANIDLADILPSIDLPPWLQDFKDQYVIALAQRSPLVLDLDGDGVELATLGAAGSVYWDIDVDGFAESSGWIAGGDGLLAIDINQDGEINDNSELFGNQADPSGAANGFQALSIYDSNGDNLITVADAQFSDLLVWIDVDADGVSQATELHTLDALGITQIDLGYTDVSYEIAGHEIKQESTFTIGGQTRAIVDAWFDFDNVNTTFAQDFMLDVRTLFLPTLRGYGTLPDLHIAMSQNETLLLMVQELATATLTDLVDPVFDAEGKIQAIMLEWAGVTGNDPFARGLQIDARLIEFVEAMSDVPYTGNIFALQADRIEETFDIAYNNFAARLFAQTELGTLLGDVSYNAITDVIDSFADLDLAVLTQLQTLSITSDNPAYFWEQVVRMVDFSVGRSTLPQASLTALEDAVITSGFTIDGDNLNNFLFGTPGNDVLNTFGGNDLIIAGAGNDTLIGGEGSDTLDGGAGNDVYVFAPNFANLGGPDLISEFANDGFDTIYFTGGITPDQIRIWADNLVTFIQYTGDPDDIIEVPSNLILGSGIELPDVIEQIVFDGDITWDLTQGLNFNDTDDAHDIYAASGDDVVLGNGGDDRIETFAGNDILEGGQGTDTLIGGAGNDTYVFNLGDSSLAAPDQVQEQQLGGDEDVVFFQETLNMADVRSWTSGSSFIIQYSSNPEDVISIQNGGAAIGGGSGAILLSSLIERAIFGEGTLWDFEQRITIIDTDDAHTLNGGTTDDLIQGNGGDDTIFAWEGNDLISGGAGNDTLVGGVGIDTADYSVTSGIGVNVNLLGSTATEDGFGGQDTVSVENVIGSAFDDTIAGNNFDNVLVGGAGNDILNGEGGIDTADYSGATGNINIRLDIGMANNDGQGGTDTLSNIENIIGGDFNDRIKGDDNANVIDGGDGADKLRGRGGDDTINGGLGNDTIKGNAGADILNGGEGNDFIKGGGGGDTINGDEGDDRINGGGGADVIMGGEGNDNLDGFRGSDELYGGAGNDILFAGTNISGDSAGDILDGGADNDTIIGSNNDDTITGGTGFDVLRGNFGSDTFVFNDTQDADLIADFTLGDDALDISNILFGYDPMTDVLADFVQVTDNTINTVISVDSDGGADNFVDIASLTFVTGVDLNDLVTNGGIIT